MMIVDGGVIDKLQGNCVSQNWTDEAADLRIEFKLPNIGSIKLQISKTFIW